MATHHGAIARRFLASTLTVGMATAASVSAQPGAGAQAFLAVAGRMPTPGTQTMTYPPGVTTGGTVDVEIVVDVNGAVAHARVAASSDSSGTMDRAILAALTGWRFTPVIDPSGRPQATLSLGRFTFSAPSADRPGVVAMTLGPLPQVAPPPLEARQLVGLPDAKQVRYSAPRPVRRINPRYTEEAMRAKVQGRVTMELIVLADGTVGAARVTAPLHDSLDNEALVAARYWYFDPARVEGQPVATKAVLQLDFNLR